MDEKWFLEKQKTKTIPKTGNNQPLNLYICKQKYFFKYLTNNISTNRKTEYKKLYYIKLINFTLKSKTSFNLKQQLDFNIYFNF